jgi:beta-glucosidase
MQLEASLLPIHGHCIKKIAYYACHLFRFLFFLPLVLVLYPLSFAATQLFGSPLRDSPLVAFAKHPKWKDERVTRAPVEIGFSTAEFQDNGPMQHPQTNWAAYFARPENRDKLEGLGTHLGSDAYIENILPKLKELGCTKFRFSISRDKIEKIAGTFDHAALQKYADFCAELLKTGIEPMVTLHHFTDPIGFDWHCPDIEGFVAYASAAVAVLHAVGVRKFLTINEPAVIAFQGWVMGEFPPHKKRDIEGAARAMENMMRVHSCLYESLKTLYGNTIEIGLTHNPIRFRHYHKLHPFWTPLEKTLCHYFTEVNHSALLRFLQTGRFSLKVPFLADYSFALDKPPPLDFIGLQYYTDPLMKGSFCTAKWSVARNPHELTDYEYRAYPQGLASAIEELSVLKIPIDITEVGIDTGLNISQETDEARITYYDRLLQVVERALAHGIPIRSLHFWTLYDNIEWHKALRLRFGFISRDLQPRGAYIWLKGLLANDTATVNAL